MAKKSGSAVSQVHATLIEHTHMAHKIHNRVFTPKLCDLQFHSYVIRLIFHELLCISGWRYCNQPECAVGLETWLDWPAGVSHLYPWRYVSLWSTPEFLIDIGWRWRNWKIQILPSSTSRASWQRFFLNQFLRSKLKCSDSTMSLKLRRSWHTQQGHHGKEMEKRTFHFMNSSEMFVTLNQKWKHHVTTYLRLQRFGATWSTWIQKACSTLSKVSSLFQYYLKGRMRQVWRKMWRKLVVVKVENDWRECCRGRQKRRTSSPPTVLGKRRACLYLWRQTLSGMRRRGAGRGRTTLKNKVIALPRLSFRSTTWHQQRDVM